MLTKSLQGNEAGLHVGIREARGPQWQISVHAFPLPLVGSPLLACSILNSEVFKSFLDYSQEGPSRTHNY